MEPVIQTVLEKIWSHFLTAHFGAGLLKVQLPLEDAMPNCFVFRLFQWVFLCELG